MTHAPPNRYVRLRDIIAPHGPLPISRSTWFTWVAAKRAPQPIRLGPRVTVYDSGQVQAFMADPGGWTPS
ncbi:MAG TPA: AlpA family phage regulatory protein [Tianweitania sediminis]|jgi:predicted DNA-binding transcriptional regulator AlpA|nr:AlpA family phage regulatory protein [Tianweitania sediminis]